MIGVATRALGVGRTEGRGFSKAPIYSEITLSQIRLLWIPSGSLPPSQVSME